MQNGTVFQRGSTWTYQYRLNGKWKTKGGYETQEACASELQIALADTGRGGFAPSDVSKLRYEDMRDAYLADNPEQRDYPGLQHLDAFFGGMKVSRVKESIRPFIEHRREVDKVSNPTIRRNLVCLRAMFNLARKEGKLGLADVPYFPMPEDSEPAGQYIEPEQFAKVLSHLPTNLKPFFTFMYATGCRLGALQKIQWDMVNADCTEIKLPGSIMKSKNPLTIVLAGKQLEPISTMLRKMFRDSSKPVFDSTNYRPEWSKACAKAGLGTWDVETRTRTGVRIHDCRCSAAINLIDSGVEADIVMKIGGWKTQAMLSRYNVMNTKRIKAAMERSGDYVAAKMNGTN